VVGQGQTSIAHLSAVRVTCWNTHPSREGLAALTFFETVAGVGLSPGAIALGDVVMYFSHCSRPMTSTPISSSSFTSSAFLPSVDLLGLGGKNPRV